MYSLLVVGGIPYTTTVFKYYVLFMELVPSNQEAYDDYIDLRGYGRTQESAINTIADLAQSEPYIESAITGWLSKAIQKGATVVGNAVIDAAGNIIANIAGSGKKKVIQIYNDMPTAKKGRVNAPVKKMPIKNKTNAQPVYAQPRAVAAPVNISKRVNMKSKPSMKGSSKGLVITHREMIGQIISSSTTLGFEADSFTINPGKFGTFPWLSTLAVNFDQYIMRKLRFYTLSNQSTTVAGRVGIGYDVDSTDVPPADRNEFFSLTYHAECAPWDSVVLDIPCDNKQRFINSHTVSDSKLIDVGQVIFMSDSIVATSTALSDVIVEYTVELIDPQQAVYSTQSFHAQNSSIATLDLVPTAGPAIGLPAGAASGFTYVSTSTILYIKLLQGYYSYSTMLYDAGAGTPVLVPALHGGTGYGNGTGGNTTHILFGVFKITTNDAYIRFTVSGVTLANLESFDIQLTRISASVYSKLGTVPLSGSALTTF